MRLRRTNMKLSQRIRKAFIDKAGESTFKDYLTIFLMLLPYALLFSLFVAIPVALAIGLSLTYFNTIQAPEFKGFLNYIMLLTQDEVFLKFVLPNTFKYA